MAVIRIVLVRPSLSTLKFKRPCSAARINAPTAPIAPASVGVAMATSMPGNPPILPNTANIKTAEGIIPRKHFFQSCQPFKVLASLGMPGKSFGRSLVNTNVYIKNKSICRIEGPHAPLYISPTDLPS